MKYLFPILFSFSLSAHASAGILQQCAAWLSPGAGEIHDVVLGRRGEPIKEALINATVLKRPDGATELVGGSWIKVPSDESKVPGEMFSVYSNELIHWSRGLKADHYTRWPLLLQLPLRSIFAQIQESRSVNLAEASNPEIVPSVFRHLFKPFLTKVARAGKTIHINLHEADEAWLKDFAALPKDRIEFAISQSLNELFDHGDSSEGSLARLELLTVCSEPELSKAARFYRQYGSALTAAEITQLPCPRN